MYQTRTKERLSNLRYSSHSISNASTHRSTKHTYRTTATSLKAEPQIN